MTKLTLTLGTDTFGFEGDSAEAGPLLTVWLAARDAVQQQQIDTLTDQLSAQNDRLRGAVTDHTPVPEGVPNATKP